MISFIIPALDEEKRIGNLLEQFKSVDIKFHKIEVIVADGGSKDRTREIAKKYRVKVVKNDRRKQNIAKNRNLGAKNAKGEILVFCDADTKIKDINFLIETIEKEFEKNKEIVGGSPRIEVNPEERIWKDIFSKILYSYGVKFTFFLKIPFAGGQCQIVRRDAFFKVGGYDEFRIHEEDTFLFQKLIKIGKLKFFDNLIVYESPRRYRKIGYRKLAWIAIKSYILQLFKKNSVKKWERVD